MAQDRVETNSLPAELLEDASVVRPLQPQEVGNTLAAKLIPVVDRIRQLSTRFGVRPYRVWLVHGQWSGLRRGMGQYQELNRTEILPTPLVAEMSAVTSVIESLGRNEEGGVTVSEISAKYSEDDLRGLTPDLLEPNGKTLRPNVEFFWEIVENRTGQPPAYRRRFTFNAAPSLSRDTLQWRVNLATQNGEPGRRGER